MTFPEDTTEEITTISFQDFYFAEIEDLPVLTASSIDELLKTTLPTTISSAPTPYKQPAPSGCQRESVIKRIPQHKPSKIKLSSIGKNISKLAVECLDTKVKGINKILVLQKRRLYTLEKSIQTSTNQLSELQTSTIQLSEVQQDLQKLVKSLLINNNDDDDE